MHSEHTLWFKHAENGLAGHLSNTEWRDRPYNAISALAQLFGHSISLVDNEVLVEDFEDLSPLQIGHHDEP